MKACNWCRATRSWWSSASRPLVSVCPHELVPACKGGSESCRLHTAAFWICKQFHHASAPGLAHWQLRPQLRASACCMLCEGYSQAVLAGAEAAYMRLDGEPWLQDLTGATQEQPLKVQPAHFGDISAEHADGCRPMRSLHRCIASTRIDH